MNNHNKTLDELMSKLKSDTEHYAQRKIIVPNGQRLIAIGQLSFAMYPIQHTDNQFHMQMLLPRQLMIMTTR
ncbi:MAG: hypothetical protein GKR77_05735 [Legionellales bacterium]|nr:hypothetical protein [Legionellales bacterium]